MTILLLCLAIIIATLVWGASRVPIRHRWRRRQARVMCEALRGRDRSPPPALIYARLRRWTRSPSRSFCSKASSGAGIVSFVTAAIPIDTGIDGQVVIDGRVWLTQAKRYSGAIRPEHVRAFASLCAARGSPVLFIHTGRTDSGRHDVDTRHGKVEIVSGRQLLALVSPAVS